MFGSAMYVGKTETDGRMDPDASASARCARSRASAELTPASGTRRSRARRFASSTPERTDEKDPGPETTHTPEIRESSKREIRRASSGRRRFDRRERVTTRPSRAPRSPKRIRPASAVSKKSQAIGYRAGFFSSSRLQTIFFGARRIKLTKRSAISVRYLNSCGVRQL